MAKYGRSASKNVESAMRRRKKGTLKSGSGRAVRSRKQAIAIGLSEAREKGAKVPRRGAKKKAAKKRSAKKQATKKRTAKKASAKRTTRRKTGTAGARTTRGSRGAKRSRKTSKRS